MRHLFLIVPAIIPTGPVKGAFALANALAPWHSVTIVSLKPGTGADARLDPRVSTIQLRGRGVRAKLQELRSLLRARGGRTGAAVISMCFSADLLAGFCRKDAVTCASVRGNLLQNYRMDYGARGVALALAHLLWLRRFDHIVAMTESMARQISWLAKVKPAVIGNFIDEEQLNTFRSTHARVGPWRFLFVGSLTERKQPMLLIEAITQLHAVGYEAKLDIVGDGPLRGQLEDAIAERQLPDHVVLHGPLREPYAELGHADVFVLPSLSEGISRAALEASYLGMICVMRRTDGNDELVGEGMNGQLFHDDCELSDAMLQAALLSRRSPAGQCKLPLSFRQTENAHRYATLVSRDQ